MAVSKKAPAKKTTAKKPVGSHINAQLNLLLTLYKNFANISPLSSII